uniref:MARVEL domain-containing protein n=1 Tax=Timema bartmani TaxID=61472 RepID=A0A7R9F5A1_9NEOP|nr:unnamed protein product [Timema bartmani]
MAEQGFPNQHVTTTTVTASNTTVQTNLRFDPLYIRTIPGILKVVQIVLNLLGFICISVSWGATTSRGSWFNTVAMTGFWFTGIMLALYLFHVVEKFYKIPWLKIVRWSLLAYHHLLAYNLLTYHLLAYHHYLLAYHHYLLAYHHYL